MEKILEEIKSTLADWKNNHVWGVIEVQVSDGDPVLIRKETKQKLNSPGGFKNGPARFETR
jgi:hypothetical protein